MKPQIDAETQRRQNMNWNDVGNDLESFKAHVQERWQSLSDEQVERIEGRREKLLHELQRTYQMSPGEAETEVQDFEAGQHSATGIASGRGPTERTREFGTGNDQGGAPRNDKHQLH